MAFLLELPEIRANFCFSAHIVSVAFATQAVSAPIEPLRYQAIVKPKSSDQMVQFGLCLTDSDERTA